jgi:Carboxypeptidase regulatory-like domain/TonB dependent receptor-like, beta-barrel
LVFLRIEEWRWIMGRKLYLLGLLVGFAITGASSLRAATQFALVTGSVFDRSTGDPISGATVRLINSTTGFAESQKTDANGDYTFPSVPPAQDYVLSAERAGYETAFKQDMKFSVGDSRLVLPPIQLIPVVQAAKPTAPPTPPAAPPKPPTEVAKQPPVEAPTPAQPAPQPKEEAKAVPPAQPAPAPPAHAPAPPPPTPVPAAKPPQPSSPPTVATTSEVTVSLDRVSNMLGGVVDSQAVHTLPLSNRDFLDLALLVPGTYPLEQGSALEGASLVVNGTRGNMNNFLLDGVDNNDYTVNQSLPFQIVEALQEFRVQTSTSPAEYGRSGGAQINSVTRSGTNKFHGTLFEFNRNSALSSEYPISTYRGGTFDAFAQETSVDLLIRGAHDPVNNPGGSYFPTAVLSDPVLSRMFNSGRDPHFNQNQFGADLGGPVVKNKAFFFFNWESSRAVINRQDFERVPDRTCRDPLACVQAYYGAGATPFFTGSAALVGQLMSLYPMPNVPASTVTDALGNPVSDPIHADALQNGAFYVGDAQNYTNSDNFLGRLDYRAGPRLSMSFKHNLQDIDQVQGGSIPKVSQYPGNGISLTGRNQNFSYNLVSTLGPRTVNEARLGWNRFRLNTLPLDHTLDASQYFKNLNFTNKGLPEILIGGFDLAGGTFGPYANLGANFTAPANRADNLYSVTDNLNLTRGRHVFKVGGEVRYNRLDVDNEAMARGLVTFFNVPYASHEDSADIASIARVAPEFGGVNGRGGLDRSFRANSFAWFAQDNWRPRPNVSINLGVRYEVNEAPVEARDRLVNDFPGACGAGEIVCLMRAGTKAMLNSDGTSLGNANFTAPRAGFNTDYNNFGPHVGIAWSPGKDGKTVVRAGGAVMFDQQALEPSANMLLNPPFVQQSMSLGFLPGIANPLLSILSDTFPAGFLTQAVNPDTGGEGFDSLWFPQPYSITARDLNSRTPYVYQFNAGIERQLGNKAVVEIGYVGSIGHKLMRNRLLLECTSQTFADPNQIANCLPTLGGIFGTASTELSDSVVNQENTANSNFHSLIARFETRSFHGLSLHAHYQWAHSIDNASSTTPPVFLFSPASADLVSLLFTINADQFAALNNANPALSLRPGLPSITTQPLLPSDSSNSPNLAGERASSNFDVRHRFVVYYMYEPPKVEKLRALGEGWGVAGIATVQSGQPFTVFGDFFGDPLRPSLLTSPNLDFSNTTSALDHAIPVGCKVVSPCAGASQMSSFDPSANLGFSPGTLPRNSFIGPGSANFDFSILKNTYLGAGERANLQLRVEVFNLLNHTNLLQPFTQFGQLSSLPGYGSYDVPNPFFGQILQARTPREIQFALKLIF